MLGVVVMKLESCKIALCLSGQPRYLKIGYEYLKRYLLDVYDIDVFVHTWWDFDKIGKQFQLSEHMNYGRQCVLEESTLSDIYSLYKPKSFMYEQSKNFVCASNVDYGKCLPNSVYSMFYSIHKANELKCLHEQSSDFKYDIVIRSRFDIIINNLNFGDIDLNSYFVSGEIYRTEQQCIPNDQFCLSSSENMDIYSDVYNQLKTYETSNVPFVGERILKHHLIDMHSKSITFCGENVLDVNIVKNR